MGEGGISNEPWQRLQRGEAPAGYRGNFKRGHRAHIEVFKNSPI